MKTFQFKDKKLAFLIFSQWETQVKKKLKDRKVSARIGKGELTEEEVTIFLLGSLQLSKTLKASVEPTEQFTPLVMPWDDPEGE